MTGVSASALVETVTEADVWSEGTGSKSVKPVKTLTDENLQISRDQAADQDTQEPSWTLTGSPPATSWTQMPGSSPIAPGRANAAESGDHS